MNREKTEEYLRNAYAIARQSKDSSNQNGSTLVSADGEIIGTANNNFPIGVEFTKARAESRPEKYRYFEHAERSALYQAARAGDKVYGATMYVPWAACCPCARGIINSGVATVVVHFERMQMTPPRWQGSVDEALDMLDEAGVTVLYHEGPIDGPEILVNGELWSPASDIIAAGSGNSALEMGVVE